MLKATAPRDQFDKLSGGVRLIIGVRKCTRGKQKADTAIGIAKRDLLPETFSTVYCANQEICHNSH